MKDKDYVDEMLKVGDCGDCCPEGALVPKVSKLERHIIAKFSLDLKGALIDNSEIVDQIKEMDVIPTYGGSK